MPSPSENYLVYCYELADSLEPAEWVTVSFVKLREAIETAASGDGVRAVHELTMLRQKFEKVLSDYLGSALQPEEITAETVAGYELLIGGLQGWIDAVNLLFMPEVGASRVKEALAQAERSNRQLVALQMFQQELADAHPETSSGFSGSLTEVWGHF